MSTFTKFDAGLLTSYDAQASAILGDDYWRVEKAFRFYLDAKFSDRWVDIPLGFLTDGASIPRFLWNIIPPWGIYGQAAVVHDRLCETLEITEVINGVQQQTKITRKECDAVLVEAMRVLNVPKAKVLVIQGGVDLYRVVANPQKPVVSRAKLSLESGYTSQLAA